MTTNTQYSIRLNQLSKSYNEVVALDNVSLNIDQGKTTAIIGPSGCGKSTLLKAINGLVRPDMGQIFIGDTPLDYQNITAVRRRIGYGVQQTGLFPHLSVANNINLLAKLEGWNEEAINQRITQLLNLSALDPQLLERYPHQLSGGQQQRVGLCRALMLQPDYLLLDEPFGAIDPITRIDIHEQFCQLQQAEPRTTVLVTHDINEALSIADFIAVMHQGNIVTHQAASDFSKLPNPQQTLLKLIRHGVA